MGGCNEQPVLAGAAEGYFEVRQGTSTFLQQGAVRINTVHAIAGAAPEVAVLIDPDLVLVSRLQFAERALLRKKAPWTNLLDLAAATGSRVRSWDALWPDLHIVRLHGKLPVDEMDDRKMSFVGGAGFQSGSRANVQVFGPVLYRHLPKLASSAPTFAPCTDRVPAANFGEPKGTFRLGHKQPYGKLPCACIGSARSTPFAIAWAVP